MATNTKPQLIILIEETKREQLKAYALANNKSMGWVVNQLIDLLLAGETILELSEIVKVNETVDIERVIEPIEKRLINIENKLVDIEDIEKRLLTIENKLVDIEVDKSAFYQPQPTKVTNEPKTIKTASDKLGQIYSYADFHDWLGITRTKRSRGNGNIAIATAKDRGLGDWVMDSTCYRFSKI